MEKKPANEMLRRQISINEMTPFLIDHKRSEGYLKMQKGFLMYFNEDLFSCSFRSTANGSSIKDKFLKNGPNM